MSEKMIEKSCADFAAVLASKAPVPGGGGAAALVGALGTALCSMVGNLTVGQIGLPLALKKIKPDLLHCTSNTAPVYGTVSYTHLFLYQAHTVIRRAIINDDTLKTIKSLVDYGIKTF